MFRSSHQGVKRFFLPVRCTGKLTRKDVHCAIPCLPNHWKDGHSSTEANDNPLGRLKQRVHGLWLTRFFFLNPGGTIPSPSLNFTAAIASFHAKLIMCCERRFQIATSYIFSTLNVQ